MEMNVTALIHLFHFNSSFPFASFLQYKITDKYLVPQVAFEKQLLRQPSEKVILPSPRNSSPEVQQKKKSYK